MARCGLADKGHETAEKALAAAYRGELAGGRLFAKAAEMITDEACRRAIDGLVRLEAAMAAKTAQALRAFGWRVPGDEAIEAVLALYPIADWDGLLAFIAEEGPPALARFRSMPELDARLADIASLLILHEEALIDFGSLATRGELTGAEEVVARATQRIAG